VAFRIVPGVAAVRASDEATVRLGAGCSGAAEDQFQITDRNLSEGWKVLLIQIETTRLGIERT